MRSMLRRAEARGRFINQINAAQRERPRSEERRALHPTARLSPYVGPLTRDAARAAGSVTRQAARSERRAEAPGGDDGA